VMQNFQASAHTQKSMTGRERIRESASTIEKSLKDIENERLGRPGVTKSKHDKMVETDGCYQCGCKEG